ncbi:ricin-type beta-trefoil lectin domain protein [Longispora albida]|uniref:ricin-type beta-trefoil lectin domain protein n=1 Tax=Longispora albida TaxID=203523 RepID=UPI00038063DC|nr:ricin-type beta-trefoil lectin domain protein [Longispora albida]
MRFKPPLAAIAVGFLAAAALAAPGSAAPARPGITPLPANLEQQRAAEATALYGSPEIKPIEQRKSSVLTMGDSEISGEGAGNYEPGTHQEGNWCDRSRDQAVWRLTIPVDVRYNIACSGGSPADLVYGSGSHQWNELNQGENLAIKARNTRVKLIWVVVGANGAGNIEFGPVATDCVKRRIFFQGTCWPTYTDVWKTRAEHTQQEVEWAVNSIKQTMTNAGYLPSDFKISLMGYPSPISPDVEDNPNFPGWYAGGCTIYLADAAFGRNKAVPMFETAERKAAMNTGVMYLDASRLFHGHEVCTENTWALGVYIENGNIFDENAARQSAHPNARGHGAFAECMSAFYNSGLQVATCADPASTGHGLITPGLMEFKQLTQGGLCLDSEAYNSRYATQLLSWGCHGGRNQGFWYDTTRTSLHVELNHDRCVDASGGIASGTKVILWDCHGGANQKWTLDAAGLHPASRSDLCVAFSSATAGSHARLTPCTGAQTWNTETRNFPNPAGYNHSDFIGSRVY